MSAGYTFLGQAVGEHYAPLVNSVLVGGILITAGLIARAALRKDPLLPEDKLSLRSIFETTGTWLLSLGDAAMGKDKRKYLPFVAVIFCYVLLMNLFGLVPGFVLSTDRFHLNAGIALVVFSMYNIWGVREVGATNYLKHFCGPVWQIALPMFCVEVVSHLIRPLTLGLRLFGNMTGDHLVLSVFNSFGIVFAVPFYLMGTIVCFLQAMIFTLLTMVYIRLAVSH